MINGIYGFGSNSEVNNTVYPIDVTILGETQIPRRIDDVEDIVEISGEAYEAFKHLRVVSKGVCLHPSMFYGKDGFRLDLKV